MASRGGRGPRRPGPGPRRRGPPQREFPGKSIACCMGGAERIERKRVEMKTSLCILMTAGEKTLISKRDVLVLSAFAELE